MIAVTAFWTFEMSDPAMLKPAATIGELIEVPPPG